MKAVLRGCALMLLALSLVPGTLADDAAASKAKSKKVSSTTAAAAKQPATAAKSVARSSSLPRGTDSPFPTAPTKSTSLTLLPEPQGAVGAGGGGKEPPLMRPVPTTAGPLGAFTVESGYLLPRRAWSASAFANRVSRMPGNATLVNLGWSFGYGFADWINGFIQWEPYRHVHLGTPAQLSMRTPTTNPGFPPPATSSTIFRSLTPVAGTAPGYIEDYPFANRNNGGIGEVILGLKFGLLSEWRGDPVSLSFTNSFYVPTRSGLSEVLDNQVQMGEFGNKFGMAMSKTWWNDKVTSTFGFGYRITRDPRQNRIRMFSAADQMTFSQATVIFPENRVQLMMEHTGLVFTGTSTQNTSFGARDPVDGVYGVRLYPWSNVAFDVGYRHTHNLGNHGDRNGFVFKLGTVYWPEKPKPPANKNPTAACSADRSSVVEGGEAIVNVRAMGSDPDNDTLTYSWSATGGKVSGTGPAVTWDPAGTRLGNYTITANVSDGKGGTASCSVDVRVEPRPNRAPSLACSADRSSVLTGERVRITGRGSDPDGETLGYTWRTNGGQIVGSGSTVTLDTTGLAPGRYTVTGRAEDPRGAAADCSVGVEVTAPPVQPQASKISECFFRNGSARVDNVCKRVLDDVAVRLQNEPRGRVVLVGYSDPKEPRAAKLGQSRGDEAKKYLSGKGVAATRVDVRSAGGQAGAGKQNRRMDVIYVPEGATY